MSNEKEFVITEDKQGLWISSPDVEMADIKHNIHPKGPTYHFVKMLQSENASLKEFPNWLLKNCFMRVLEGGKGEWHMRGEVGAYSSEEMFEKFKLLINESDEKPKEGTGSINPTVTMHNDFTDRIGRDLKR